MFKFDDVDHQFGVRTVSAPGSCDSYFIFFTILFIILLNTLRKKKQRNSAFQNL